MKQIMQNLQDGSVEIAEAPCPAAARGTLLIQTRETLVSAGTERMLVEFGKANLVNKARQQPDKVRMVLDKAKTDGLITTVDAVRRKLAQPIALGYCNVGTVIEAGPGVEGIVSGDRVVSNGKHADIVSVPKNLCVKIPDNVPDEDAAFTVLGAIGLQGIRLANPTLGECVAVTGLGLIGLLTVQMLLAQGCRVLGIDTNQDRLELARSFGASVVNADDDVVTAAMGFSRGRGIDAVIITAATSSNEPVSQAAQMCRKRGRIILVGVSGLNLSRADFFEKELSFQVSCSYGPGRYDPAYEEGGHDYPVGYVRWTEQRNFEAVLDLMAKGALDVSPLITHRIAFERAEDAYALLSSDEPYLGIVLKYPTPEHEDEIVMRERTIEVVQTQAAVGQPATFVLLGAGNYASQVLAPAFVKAGATPITVVSNQGVTAKYLAKSIGFRFASTDTAAAIIADSSDTVVIGTRHDLHASQVLAGLRAGKHIFCEKPLCLNAAELAEIEAETGARPTQKLMVGYNRRFSPLIVKAKQLLATVDSPKSFIMTVNAGHIPADHWTQDPLVGGGRIIGEACHFVDLIRHLAGAPITSAHAVRLGNHPTMAVADDKATITLSFADGSVGVIHYLANGHKAVPKERLEIFAAGRILQLDNFRKLTGFGWRGFNRMALWKQDKGAEACVNAFVQSILNSTDAPIATAEIIETTRWTIDIAERLR